MHSESAPKVFVLEPVEPATVSRPRRRLRLRGAVLAAAGGMIILTAVRLRPHTSGSGTHQQLGLPACSFQVRTGMPCPSCGMTTAFAATAHGQFALALAAHPFGLFAFCAVVALTGAGLAELGTGRNVLAKARPGLWWLWCGLAAMFGGWAWKLVAAGWTSAGAG